MSCNLVHWVPRARALGRAGLLAVVAACAADEGLPEDAQSSGAVSASGAAGATSGSMQGVPAAAAPSGGVVAGNAARSVGVPAAGSSAAAGGVTSGVIPAAGNSAPVAAGSGAVSVGSSAAGGGAPVAAGGAGSAAAGGGAAPVGGAAASSAGASGVTAGAGGSGGGSGGTAATGGAITVWLAGDSTVAKGNTPCPVGWGAEFQDLFKPEAKVVNSAVGGRSVRTWLYEVQTQMDSTGECALNKDSSGEPVLQARWQMMLDGMKMGDFLFIQFGINDSSATCDRHVGIEAFKESYGMMAEAAKMRGAQPVFVTPVSAISCSGSMAKPTRGNYVTATIDAGKKYDVPVIDLHERSIALYNQQGLCPIPGGGDVSASTGGKTGAFFCDDHTHFSSEGAAQIAELMAQALKDQKLGLAAYLK